MGTSPLYKYEICIGVRGLHILWHSVVYLSKLVHLNYNDYIYPTLDATFANSEPRTNILGIIYLVLAKSLRSANIERMPEMLEIFFNESAAQFVSTPLSQIVKVR